MQEINTTRCAMWKIVAIVAFLVILVVFFGPFLIVILVVIYLKTDLDLEKTLKSLWIYDCFWISAKTKVPWKNLPESQIEKPVKKVYYDYIRDMLNEKNKWKFDTMLEVKKEKKKEKLEFIWEDKLVNNKSKIRYRRRSNDNAKTKDLHFKTDKKYEFNWWKSIWDDYESVIDNLDKK